MKKELANLLFPEVKKTREDMEVIYPVRRLPFRAKVTRIAPSPTGFIHLGNLYNTIIAERLAHQSKGVFYLRIEDTDQKREVKGAIEKILSALDDYLITLDEGGSAQGELGTYGPYRQSERKEIYQVYAKWLVEQGVAYPCFCREDELDKVRQQQIAMKVTTGYYGVWASCRSLTLEEIKRRLEAGDSYVLRFRAPEHGSERIKVQDGIRGLITMPVNEQDFVLLKSDGIPTYHFAHVVDDHLMRTTHVFRDDTWIPSLPIHIQLFQTFGWEIPVYCHTATLMKMDGNSKRKLSKRKDPELALSFYQEEGYPVEALWIYLLTILNSNFEEWYQENENKNYSDFLFTIEHMSNSGALFDLNKLRDISKTVISKMKVNDIYDELLRWANNWKKEVVEVLENNKETALKALNVGRNTVPMRKDFITWKQTYQFLQMYFKEAFVMEDSFPSSMTQEIRTKCLQRYLILYDSKDDKETWFQKVQSLTEEMGFAVKVKDYKKSPEQYLGSIVDVTSLLRVAITGRQNSPDLWEVSQVLGMECIKSRINNAI